MWIITGTEIESIKMALETKMDKKLVLLKFSTLLLPYIVPVKSRVKISQNFVASSEYMNFNQPESIPGNL